MLVKKGGVSLALIKIINHQYIRSFGQPLNSLTLKDGTDGAKKSVHLGGIYENLVPYPLNFYTFDPIYVVTFLISCKILWILRGSWVNILCILCHLHSFRLGSGLVTELNQGHQHGQTESADQNVEDPGHVAQAQGTGLLLQNGDQRQSRLCGWRWKLTFKIKTWHKREKKNIQPQQLLKRPQNAPQHKVIWVSLSTSNI